MDDKDTKRGTPAYVPYKTFTNTINSLKESGAPSQIDRSVLSSMSGSDQSAIIGSFKYLGLISEQGVPSSIMLQLIDSSEEQRGALLRDVLTKSYAFLFSGSIDLKKATTKQVEDAFRDQGASGSTIVKCIAFFLAAAKAAGIPISAHVKTPAPVRSTTQRVRGANPPTPEGALTSDQEVPEGMKQIRIQLMDKPDVILSLPVSFDSNDWTFLEPILKAYINRMLKDTLA